MYVSNSSPTIGTTAPAGTKLGHSGPPADSGRPQPRALPGAPRAQRRGQLSEGGRERSGAAGAGSRSREPGAGAAAKRGTRQAQGELRPPHCSARHRHRLHPPPPTGGRAPGTAGLGGVGGGRASPRSPPGAACPQPAGRRGDPEPEERGGLTFVHGGHRCKDACYSWQRRHERREIAAPQTQHTSAILSGCLSAEAKLPPAFCIAARLSAGGAGHIQPRSLPALRRGRGSLGKSS